MIHRIGLRCLPPFHLAEIVMLRIAVCVLIIDIVLGFFKGAQIDVAGYATLIVLMSFIMSLGLYYRISGRSGRIASALVGSGAFIFFSASLSLFNYLLLPVSRSFIDIAIAEIDALFGFYWPDIMELAAANPITTQVLKFAYMTTIPQFALLFAILGLSGKLRDLHVMMISITITATLTICFWGVFPTFGAKSIYFLPPEIWAAVNPVVNEEYAKELLHVGANGPGMISPAEIRGLVAFPSYHAVLAFTAMYAAHKVRFAREVFVVLNLLILPGIFIHGGHHLMDLAGGVVMFILGIVLAERIVGCDLDTHRFAEKYI